MNRRRPKAEAIDAGTVRVGRLHLIGTRVSISGITSPLSLRLWVGSVTSSSVVLNPQVLPFAAAANTASNLTGF